MSEYETKDFTGVLFRNDKRERDSQPQAKGSAVIDGVEYWVSAWTNESAKGNKYQSLKFTRKDDVHNAGMAQAKAAIGESAEVIDDDIPF